MYKVESLLKNRRREFYCPPQALQQWNPNTDLIRNADGDEDCTISVLDVIGCDFWTGEGVTAKRVSAALRNIGDRDVIVNMNSPGGSFFEGLAIYNVLKLHPRNVTVNILGVAASAASVIAMAGDEIRIAKAGFLMTHNTMIGVYGNKETFRREADWLEQFDDVAHEVYADRTGIDVADIASANNAAGEDGIWISGKKAVEDGYADGYLESDVQNATKTPDQKALCNTYIVDQALALAQHTRSMRREIIKSLTNSDFGKLGAADDTPSAVILAGVNDILNTIRQL